jgi:2-dehydropantoate 2-reductase
MEAFYELHAVQGRLMPSILLIGSGAMANAFAARFSQYKDCSIQLFSEWEQGNQAIREQGIHFTQAGTTLQIPPLFATHEIEKIKPADLILVFVKSWQTEQVVSQVQEKLLPAGVCMTLQNGLGNYEILSEHFGKDHVNLGTTTLGATLECPGRVQVHMQGTITIGQHPSNDWIIPLFQSAGFSIESVPDLESILWGKLIINAVINPLSALLQVTNGGLDDDPYSLALADAIIDEIQHLMKLKHISLPYPDPHQRIREIIAQSETNHSSMFQDWQRNAPTEIESITGAILKDASTYHLEMPVNRTIYHLIKTELARKMK